MATLNAKVTAFVRKRIEKDYDTPTADLYREAIAMDPSIRRRALRSFFASYVLPARRKHNSASKPAAPAKAAAKAPTGKKRGRPRKVQPEAGPDLSLSRMPESAPVASPPVHVPKRSASANTAEDVLRRVLTEVARDAMRAESRSEFIDLLARIDRHAREISGSFGS